MQHYPVSGLACLVSLLGSFSGECAAILEKQGIKPSYYEVAKATYPWAQILVDGAIALKCFGVSISYLLIVGQLVPEALMEGFGVPATSIWVNRRFWVSLIFVLVAPIAALKKLGGFASNCQTHSATSPSSALSESSTLTL